MKSELERLKEVFTELKNNGHIKNYADLSRKISFSTSAVLNIFNGARGISSGFLKALEAHYPSFNIGYVVEGVGHPFEGDVYWNNPVKKVKYVPEDRLGEFGFKYTDKDFIDDLPESFFDMEFQLNDSDRMFYSQYRHPDEVFLPGDRLYTVETTFPKVGESYYVVTKQKQLCTGVYRSDPEGYFIENIQPNTTQKKLYSTDILKYWEISGRITLKVRPKDAYMTNSPKELVDLMKAMKKKGKN